MTAVATTIIVPTYNEGYNSGRLVRRLTEAFDDRADVEILFVDDSTDVISVALIEGQVRNSLFPVRMIHREGDERVGGLAGAVSAGIRAAYGRHIVVMDGDLQHPPELVPLLVSGLERADLVVASRYCGDGDASGLSSSLRRAVSSSSTMLAKACFPRRVGRVCTDPMTGFFAFRRDAVDLDKLQPRGFKILLEILARHDLRVAEVPFTFGEREEGESKASWRNGLQFLYQMASLRMGRMSRFAAVGALGTIVNLGIMALLVHGVLDINYVVASIVAAEVSILHNFLMQERFVFRDMRTGSIMRRASQFFGLNNGEALIRIPLLIALVEWLAAPPVLAQAGLLAIAFLGRFLFTSRVIYRPRPISVTHIRTEAVVGMEEVA